MKFSKKTSKLRRNLLKMAATTGTVAGGAYWSKPVVQSVLLPAHAQSTATLRIYNNTALPTTTFNQQPSMGDEPTQIAQHNHSLLDLIVPPAHAGFVNRAAEIHIAETGLASNKFTVTILLTADYINGPAVATGELHVLNDAVINQDYTGEDFTSTDCNPGADVNSLLIFSFKMTSISDGGTMIDLASSITNVQGATINRNQTSLAPTCPVFNN